VYTPPDLPAPSDAPPSAPRLSRSHVSEPRAIRRESSGEPAAAEVGRPSPSRSLSPSPQSPPSPWPDAFRWGRKAPALRVRRIACASAALPAVAFRRAAMRAARASSGDGVAALRGSCLTPYFGGVRKAAEDAAAAVVGRTDRTPPSRSTLTHAASPTPNRAPPPPLLPLPSPALRPRSPSAPTIAASDNTSSASSSAAACALAASNIPVASRACLPRMRLWMTVAACTCSFRSLRSTLPRSCAWILTAAVPRGGGRGRQRRAGGGQGRRRTVRVREEGGGARMSARVNRDRRRHCRAGWRERRRSIRAREPHRAGAPRAAHPCAARALPCAAPVRAHAPP
jgi:hypothetical protein